MKKIRVFAASISAFLVTAFVPAVSAATVDTGKITNSLDNLYTYLAALGIPAGVIALTVAGFAFLGPRSAKEWAKTHVMQVAAGLLIILLAPSLIIWLSGVVS